MAVGVDTADEATGEGVGLSLGVGPEHVVPELVVDGLDPLPLGVVLASLLPVLRVYEMDLAVLVAAAGGAAPVEILEPLHPGTAQVVEAAQRADRAPEFVLAMIAEEGGQLAVDRAACPRAGKDHAHVFWPWMVPGPAGRPEVVRRH